MTVKCMICGEELRVVSYSHLKYCHDISIDDYRKRFPDSSMVCESTRDLTSGSVSKSMTPEARQQRSNTLTGIVRSEDTRKAISVGKMGHEVSKETRQLISASVCRSMTDVVKRWGEGGRSWETGRLHSKESKALMSIRIKESWKDPEVARRRLVRLSPNDSELQLQNVLDKHFPKEWKYVGNGQMWVDGRNPDFTNVNGKKQVIELFGIYWHDPILFPKRPTEEELVAHYGRFGFDCIVIWEYDIYDELNITNLVRDHSNK